MNFTPRQTIFTALLAAYSANATLAPHYDYHPLAEVADGDGPHLEFTDFSDAVSGLAAIHLMGVTGYFGPN